MRTKYKVAAAAGLAVALGVGAVGAMASPSAPAPVHGHDHDGYGNHVPADPGYKYALVYGKVRPLNGTKVNGAVAVQLNGRTAEVRFNATGLLAGAPHAMHFHAGAKGTCPSGSADKNRDGFVSVTEGHPFYGGIQTSLTTKGDTTPASGLAIDRFPTSPKGTIAYHRTITLSAQAAAALRAGNAVFVVHGVDRNKSGAYDGSVKSDLNPMLPMEATAPAGCGPIKVLLHN